MKCPNCQGNLKIWDLTNTGTLENAGLSLIAGFGVLGFIPSIFGSSKLLKHQKETAVLLCSECEKKFTGPKLKPFEWSDYKGR